MTWILCTGTPTLLEAQSDLRTPKRVSFVSLEGPRLLCTGMPQAQPAGGTLIRSVPTNFYVVGTPAVTAFEFFCV